MIQNSSIISVPFQKRQESALECEVLRLEHLFRRKIDTYLSRPQRQTFYMMCWIIKGEGEHTLDFRSYRYQQGNLIFITPGPVFIIFFSPL